jgi:hypothetical protein
MRFAVLLAVLSLGACGCSRDGPDLVDVSGRVTYQGEPLAKGEIRFIPTGTTVGPVSGSSIVGGEYAAKGKGGVPLGTHRIEITGTRPKADSMPDPNVPFVQEEQFLPEQYNTKSKLEFNITPGNRTVTKDFALD